MIMELSQLKQQLALEILNDARIFAAHRVTIAPSARGKGYTNEPNLALSPSDLHLSAQKHAGAKWRPPTKLIITNIAEEINTRPLSPARAQ